MVNWIRFLVFFIKNQLQCIAGTGKHIACQLGLAPGWHLPPDASILAVRYDCPLDENNILRLAEIRELESSTTSPIQQPLPNWAGTRRIHTISGNSLRNLHLVASKFTTHSFNTFSKRGKPFLKKSGSPSGNLRYPPESFVPSSRKQNEHGTANKLGSLATRSPNSRWSTASPLLPRICINPVPPP